MIDIVNGAVYRAKWPLCWTFVLVWLDGFWGALAVDRHADPELSCPIFQHDQAGEWKFPEVEITSIAEAQGWERIPGRLVIEEGSRA